MPGPLQNLQHELFVRNLIKGAKDGKLNGRRAYLAAGYRCTPDSADAAASRLLTNVRVKQRMTEILAPAARKTQVSTESLLAELQITIEDARASKQYGVVVRALELAAKLVGLLRERIEVSQGDFAGLKSPGEVLDLIRVELGDAAADAIQAALDPAAVVGADTVLTQREKTEKAE